jgi:hypothetical protein
MLCAGCWRPLVSDPILRRGVTRVYSLEKLLEFRAVPSVDKLRWLEEMRQFLDRFLTPERRVLMARFRRGEL